MKKLLSAILALCMALSMTALSYAEETTEESKLYQLGNHVEDFSFTLVDGTEGTLYGLLAEKKVVLLNLWATWCTPCRMEFPALEAAYMEMQEDAAVVCLSVEGTDDEEKINAMREELGLSVLPMGKAPDGLMNRFTDSGIPATAIIDRNGVLCFLHVGTLPDENKFIRLMETYTADDYDAPVLLTEVPAAVSKVEEPDAAQARAALSLADDVTLSFQTEEDALCWPFVLNADGTALVSSNGAVRGTKSSFALTLTSEEGEGLSFEYLIDCLPTFQSLTVSVDGEMVEMLAGQRDWKEYHFAFAQAGNHEVTFEFIRDDSVDGDYSAAVRAVRKVNAEELAVLDDARESIQIAADAVGAGNCVITLVEGQIRGVMTFMGVTSLMESDTLVYAIAVNENVDMAHAYLADGAKRITMLRDLPNMGGYLLYTAKREPLSTDTLLPTRMLAVYDDIRKSAEQRVMLASTTFYQTAEDLDLAWEILLAFFGGVSGETESNEELNSWHYLDGSEKEGATDEIPTVETPLNADGTANYTVQVQDVNGQPVSGAMVQVCDPSTCQVFFTDDTGCVAFAMTPYAYEVHLLKVPDGLQKPSEVFHLPELGGTLEITLEQE